jgi:hypothetical protein
MHTDQIVQAIDDEVEKASESAVATDRPNGTVEARASTRAISNDHEPRVRNRDRPRANNGFATLDAPPSRAIRRSYCLYVKKN